MCIRDRVKILGEGARVGVEVLVGPELEGVDKDTDDNGGVGNLFCGADKLHVSIVEGPHGGDEGDGSSVSMKFFGEGGEVGGCGTYLQGRILTSHSLIMGFFLRKTN